MLHHRQKDSPIDTHCIPLPTSILFRFAFKLKVITANTGSILNKNHSLSLVKTRSHQDILRSHGGYVQWKYNVLKENI